MTFGSLFAGIGGMDLGLERAGMKCKWQVEIDPFCRQVLTKHWPEVPKYEDVRTVGSELERVDLIAGGFPCQDLSVAGRRRGIQEGTRSGLWSEYARIIGTIRPRFVLIENVSGLLANESMRRVLGDLSVLGMDVQWRGFRATEFGAWHERYRVFMVAYPSGFRQPLCPEFFSFIEESFTESGYWQNTLVPPRIQRVVNGIPVGLERLKGCGNAVCPPVAEWIGRRIMEAESKS
jgi:DNA (cytosine-5)-methyltransferase 1